MWIQQLLDADSPRRWFLNSPEAQVMTAEHERELLLELAECRRSLLQATRRPDGSEWDLSRPDSEFRRAVRSLASGSGDAAPVLSSESRAAIAMRARRYEEIRGALSMANARLVAYLSKGYLNRGISPADLIQEGFCGLLEAIDRFDPVNTTRLATYASWWIRQALQRAIANGGYPVRLTPRQLRRLAQALPKSSEGSGADATTPGVTPYAPAGPPAASHNPSIWRELAAIRPRISLDVTSRLDDSTVMADLLAFVPEADREASELSEHVESILTSLAPREQLVLKLRFGLDGHPRHSLSQLGEVLAISKERVRQLQDRALRKLRDALEEIDHFDLAGAPSMLDVMPDMSPETAGLG